VLMPKYNHSQLCHFSRSNEYIGDFSV